MSSAVVLPELGEEVFEGEEFRDEKEKLYYVILLNDEDHTYDYVIEMLVDLFGFDEGKAYDHTVEVDKKGHSRLVTLPLAQAERKRDQIHAYGADWRLERSQGAMAALVEPVE
ncbi:MAG: ATP-dependent Clp protease adaptor ClpS [Acidobacteria bacterium]|nr:ATP-dependent Clp protease adaptor ClpS [Acidobacteriota bacterium]